MTYRELSLETVFVDDPGFPEFCRLDHPLVREWQQVWRDLSVEHKDPFTHPVWLLNWMRCHGLGSGRQLGLYILRVEDRLLTVIPFELRRLGIFPAGLACYLSHRSEHILEGASLALDAHYREDVLALLLNSRVRGFARPSYLYFEQVDASNQLLQCANAIFCMPSIRRSIIRSPADYEAFLDELGKNFKGSLRKARNKLNAHSQVVFSTITQPGDVPAALERYMEVDEASWKAHSGATLKSNAATRDLIESTLVALAGEQQASIQLLSIDGQDVGAQMCLLFDGTLHVLKVCYREGFEKISPGNMILEWTLREFCPAHAVETVSLVTDLAWHDKWKPGKLPTFEVFLFRKGLRGLFSRLLFVPWSYRAKLFLIRHGLFDKLKRMLKR